MADQDVEDRDAEGRGVEGRDVQGRDVEEVVRADVARVLGCESAQVDPEEDLFERGLDSVRLMTLVERWRSAGLPGLEFPDLAEQPRLSAWVALARGVGAGGRGR